MAEPFFGEGEDLLLVSSTQGLDQLVESLLQLIEHYLVRYASLVKEALNYWSDRLLGQGEDSVSIEWEVSIEHELLLELLRPTENDVSSSTYILNLMGSAFFSASSEACSGSELNYLLGCLNIE